MNDSRARLSFRYTIQHRSAGERNGTDMRQRTVRPQ